MALGLVKNKLSKTLGGVAIAALSFIPNAYSGDLELGGYPNEPSKITIIENVEYQCLTSIYGPTSESVVAASSNSAKQMCKPAVEGHSLSKAMEEERCNPRVYGWDNNTLTLHHDMKNLQGECLDNIVQTLFIDVGLNTLGAVNTESEGCEDSKGLGFTYPIEGFCYRETDLQDALSKGAQSSQNDSACEGLLLSSGSNTADAMCYTAASGLACELGKVSDQSGNSYYAGVGSQPLGCANSPNPFFNDGGDNPNDSCMNVAANVGGETSNYCVANKEKHCSSVSGTEICDDGCLQIGEKFMCNPDKHPDVGEGSSDYFDDNGICSLLGGNAYRGACEELGGVWDKTMGDYTNVSCPAATAYHGTCSITSHNSCYSCTDDGGQWSGAEIENYSVEAQATQDVANLTQKSNEKLDTMDNSIRKSGESVSSTMSSSADRIIAAINNKPVGGGGASSEPTNIQPIVDELKKQNDTAITSNTLENTGFTDLFNAAEMQKLNDEIAAIQNNIKDYQGTIKAELTSLINFTPPSGAGYQTRPLDIKGASIDISLSRFQSLFQQIQPAVYLLCSIAALFILLGSRKE
ncbi:hypothetical protein [Thalassotalea sp. ND16A]|uniref:hypothetical protein n=1 Tax=Thalassotalea sp. ND16A TaxID=1535422 RepID=UPI00051A2E3E|nr:hypothetical protein [Thalassotalea sp. ND16A]KGK00285.1 hypothetical protein ND16A_3621 [Thalassotalea sp. ND16A]